MNPAPAGFSYAPHGAGKGVVGMDLTVTYRGPDGMSQQLWDEVRARYGARAQNKGFVTGYMDAARAGQTGGHFADRHGITHAVDIGVDIEADGTGLLPADALALAEHLRALGAAGQHPFSQRGYLIHDLSTTTTPAPRIAGFHTGWKWVPYTGASPHSDHIHVTTGGDQQWGGPPQLEPAVYNSTQSWGVTQTGGEGMNGAMRPVPENYPVTQTFYANATIYNYGAGHGAIDYGVPVGTPVLAPEDMTIIHADWVWNLKGGSNDWAMRDYQIKPAPGDTRTGGGIAVAGVNAIGSHWWKCHLSRTDLNPGDKVKKGQIIGWSGNTGSSTGPHLHLSLLPPNPIWSNGYFGAIDPAPYIKERYAPLTYTTWQGSPTTGKGSTTTGKDWFDMATEADLRRVVREEILKNVQHAEFTDINGKKQTFGQIWRFRTKKAEQLLGAIAQAVRPSTIALAVWGYKNTKVNGDADAYQLVTDTRNNVKKGA